MDTCIFLPLLPFPISRAYVPELNRENGFSGFSNCSKGKLNGKNRKSIKVLFEEERQVSKNDSKARQTVFLLFFFGISSFTSPSHQRQERIVVAVQQCFCFFRATKIEASSRRLPRNAGMCIIHLFFHISLTSPDSNDHPSPRTTERISPFFFSFSFRYTYTGRGRGVSIIILRFLQRTLPGSVSHNLKWNLRGNGGRFASSQASPPSSRACICRKRVEFDNAFISLTVHYSTTVSMFGSLFLLCSLSGTDSESVRRGVPEKVLQHITCILFRLKVPSSPVHQRNLGGTAAASAAAASASSAPSAASRPSSSVASRGCKVPPPRNLIFASVLFGNLICC